METSVVQSAASNDVLHIPSTNKLSPEEIAKAIAHHKKHHHDQPQPAAKPGKHGK
jgi:hypothetical protein